MGQQIMVFWGMLGEVKEILGVVEVVLLEEEGAKNVLLEGDWGVIPVCKQESFVSIVCSAGQKVIASSNAQNVLCAVKMATAMMDAHTNQKTSPGNRAEAEPNPRGKIPSCKTMSCL